MRFTFLDKQNVLAGASIILLKSPKITVLSFSDGKSYTAYEVSFFLRRYQSDVFVETELD